ncbi:MAG: glycine--tRNA ligase [Planctomycetota bacterium]|jgi:glycyl-tRNA synthetase
MIESANQGAAPSGEKLMQKITSLCKRRGFVFPSSEIYGGLKSAYDYGPLGVELKRNIMDEWWRNIVHERENVVGLDGSIIMHSQVWRSSGHLASFTDPLVDCKICKERFRADRAPRAETGTEAVITAPDKGLAKQWVEMVQKQFCPEIERKGKTLLGARAGDCGYVCPVCGSPFLSDERAFNMMFRSFLGAVDPMAEVVDALMKHKDKSMEELLALVEKTLEPVSVYLRPETAQAIFCQFQNVQQSLSMKIPFGIAQVGKSFRNEITVEHFIFRSCEFEQLELEFFCEPEEDMKWFDYWKEERMAWWRRYANDPERFRFRKHEADELAHYSKECYDIEYEFPWGWDELEGIAHRGDYDLIAHSKGMVGEKKAASPKFQPKLNYLDPEMEDPETGKKGYRYVPTVIEPSGGLTRGFLVYLVDAFTEDEVPNAQGELEPRTVLKLHPRLAPIKAAVLPLVKKEGMPERAREIVQEFRKHGINSRYDEQHAIGRRYRRHDEIGTPYALTVDGQTLEDDTVTIRDRDTTKQERIKVDEAVEVVLRRLMES